MKIRTYQEAIQYLESHIPPTPSMTRVMDLSRIEAICELLGHPERKYPIIHVGGTSGKGSTATFASYILQNMGINVGLHLSPHVDQLTERIQVNNQNISEQEFVNVLNDLLPSFEKVKQSEAGVLTYFEMLVAMTFYVFAQKKVDAAVIEVGLGGRLDATNIIPPSLAMLTNVSLDHTNILGNTIEQIASDKIEIIKTGSIGVVSGFTQPSVIKLIQDKAYECQVPLYLLGNDFNLRNETVSLAGIFQKANFSLAAKAVEIFIKKYFPEKLSILVHAIKQASQDAFIPGRLEIISQSPLIILDGAHNPAKMQALVDSLTQMYPQQKFISIVAFKKDKPARQLIQILNPVTQEFYFTRFLATTDVGMRQSIAPEELSQLTDKPYQIFENVNDALEKALKLPMPLLVTGSLYLVGEARKHLNKENYLRAWRESNSQPTP